MATEVSELLEYGKGVIKMITLAPEVCSPDIISQIAKQGIIISAGHSNIDYFSAMKSFKQGVTAVTHLYNAMSSFHHRMPGLVGAAFDHDRVMASIIPDGHHVDYSAIRIAKTVMKERLFAITDAVTDTDRGEYKHTLSGDKYEAKGILSGSALDMRKALYNLVNEVGIETGEALRMCSLYPARLMGMDKMVGMIEKGFKADLVLLGDDIKNAKLLE
jgi:N-acetylglucosamine-6-phosphate deacetylase